MNLNNVRDNNWEMEIKKNKSSYVKYILILVVVFILSGMVGAFFANALVDNKPDYNEDDKKRYVSCKR